MDSNVENALNQLLRDAPDAKKDGIAAQNAKKVIGAITKLNVMQEQPS